MELIYKYMLSEEQEIIDLLLELDPNRTDLKESIDEVFKELAEEENLDEGVIANATRKAARKGAEATLRVAGLGACKSIVGGRPGAGTLVAGSRLAPELKCKIKVYQKYIGMLQKDAAKASDSAKEKINAKLKAAQDRVSTWQSNLKDMESGKAERKEGKKEKKQALKKHYFEKGRHTEYVAGKKKEKEGKKKEKEAKKKAKKDNASLFKI